MFFTGETEMIEKLLIPAQRHKKAAVLIGTQPSWLLALGKMYRREKMEKCIQNAFLQR